MIGKDSRLEPSSSSNHEMYGRWLPFHRQPPFEVFAPSCGKTNLWAKAHGDRT
jgi:hypothetical protein